MLLLQALVGILAFIALALPFSSNIRRINWRLVLFAVALQFIICALLLKAPGIRDSIVHGADSVTALALDAF
jgi:nucleoside permease NupC